MNSFFSKHLFQLLFFLYPIMVSAQTEKTSSIERGQLIYEDFCVNCHLPQGQGVEHTFPPLNKSDFLKQNLKESIRGIKFGQKGKIIVNDIEYSGYMPSMGLSNKEIADVINYINNSWDNESDIFVTEDLVKEIKLK